MKIIENLRPWLGRKSVRGALLIVVIGVLLIVFSVDSKDDSSKVVSNYSLVELTTPSEYIGGQKLSVIGTVRAFSEALITTEQAGRVVSVNVELGQEVTAGKILATLENASERASVLQAEGVYDAAVAAAAQSNVGVNEAKTILRNAENEAASTFKSAYNSVNVIVRNSIDDFFADGDSRIPGLRIDGKNLTSQMNAERINYQTLLLDWEDKAGSISVSSDLYTELQYAEQSVQRTTEFVDNFLTIFSVQNNSGSRYTDDELQQFIVDFTAVRSTLIGLQATIDDATAQLLSAENVTERAQLASSGGVTSAADAQVKQALGTLRSAQANLAKTILRTPISGTVNSLSVRTGDFIGMFDQISIVANNDALEIVTYVSDTEKKLIAIGDVMQIENEFEGIVTQIAPAVDSKTRKTEIRIATEGIDISNGDTVIITKELETTTVDSAIRVPLTAVKFERENGFVFNVVDNKLQEIPVELGNVLGGSVEIISGLTNDDEFVIDSRGLVNGETIEIAK
jgi:RND family efflux transporter MFP subunit